MTAKLSKPLLIQRWEEISQKLLQLAQELPEDALERPPVTGVRSYGAVLRHVAFWNQYVAATLLGNTADDTANELAIGAHPTKTSVIEALRTSSKAVLSALDDGRSEDEKTAELLIPFIEHSFEHDGQLVVYRRLPGVVPPTSR